MKAASAPKTAARKLANQIWMNQDYQKNPDKYRANYNKGDFSIEEIERLYNYSKGITYNY